MNCARLRSSVQASYQRGAAVSWRVHLKAIRTNTPMLRGETRKTTIIFLSLCGSFAVQQECEELKAVVGGATSSPPPWIFGQVYCIYIVSSMFQIVTSSASKPAGTLLFNLVSARVFAILNWSHLFWWSLRQESGKYPEAAQLARSTAPILASSRVSEAIKFQRKVSPFSQGYIVLNGFCDPFCYRSWSGSFQNMSQDSVKERGIEPILPTS